MNISEASHVARILRLLDGSYSGSNPAQLAESIDYLRVRAEKPLQVTITLRSDVLRRNVDDLLTHIEADRTAGRS